MVFGCSDDMLEPCPVLSQTPISDLCILHREPKILEASDLRPDFRRNVGAYPPPNPYIPQKPFSWRFRKGITSPPPPLRNNIFPKISPDRNIPASLTNRHPPPPLANPHICYYTPLPLNLANKQQASNKQALLLSVLPIAPPHRSGLYSTVAILEPRWWPCQFQGLSQKLTGGAPGWGREVGRCHPKTAHFVPQNSFFWPKTAPKPNQNGQTKRKGPNTTHVPRWRRDQEPFIAL